MQKFFYTFSFLTLLITSGFAEETFLSLKKNKVNVRYGPSFDSDIKSKMFVTELDNFVRKFHQLWNDGLTAHLDLDTHAGTAWVGLRVQLG